MNSSNSKSTQANERRARKALQAYSKIHNAPDVTLDSSILVTNLVAKYCKYGEQNALKNDAMGSLIQGFKIVYEDSGHIEAWSVRDGRASGNALIGNSDITKLRRAHRIHLAHLGIISISARLLTAAIVCDHTAKFWYRGNYWR